MGRYVKSGNYQNDLQKSSRYLKVANLLLDLLLSIRHLEGWWSLGHVPCFWQSLAKAICHC